MQTRMCIRVTEYGYSAKLHCTLLSILPLSVIEGKQANPESLSFPPLLHRLSQGHRAYFGHRKMIFPEKRRIARLVNKRGLSQEEFDDAIVRAHRGSQGQPQLRTVGFKRDKDVIMYPVPDCMCRTR